MKKEEIIIMYDSPEAAKPITLDGWASGGKDSFFFKDEHSARWRGCTHLKCECGNIMEKMYTKCDSCRTKIKIQKFQEKPFKEWDGSFPVTTSDGDTFFFEEESIIDYCEENELEEIDLLYCKENRYRHIDADYWDDYMPEDGDIPKELEEAIKNINALIDTLPAQSYSPDKIRTLYKVEKDKI